MTVQINLKTDSNIDAQKHGHVGYNSNKIYENVSGDDLVRDKNAERSIEIFSTDLREEYSDSSAAQIAIKMISERLSKEPGGGSFNPDFSSEEAINAYSYSKTRTSENKERSDDLSNTPGSDEEGVQRFAPNVAFPNNEEVPYRAPFKCPTSNGGFGNSAEEGSQHSGGLSGSEGFLDSIEILSKY